MSTEVQSFVQEEVANLLVDDDSLTEWRKLQAELGLAGQSNLMSNEEDATPIPYLWLNSKMERVITELCPRKQNIERYSKTPIPVEVLRAVQVCRKEKYFDKIQIWFTDEEPDPVCVGLLITGAYSYNDDFVAKHNLERGKTYKRGEVKKSVWKELIGFHTNEESYLIARWGDMARSFDELKQMAIDLYKRRTSAKCQLEINKLKRELEDLEDQAVEHFG